MPLTLLTIGRREEVKVVLTRGSEVHLLEVVAPSTEGSVGGGGVTEGLHVAAGREADTSSVQDFTAKAEKRALYSLLL